MKPPKPLVCLGLIVFLLLALYFISSNVALIPILNTIMFAGVLIICFVLGVFTIRAIYTSHKKPLEFKGWSIIILTSIVMFGGILFGVLYASVDNKAAGLFTTYSRRYKFKKVTFYTYETNLLGTTTTVRYSKRGEIVSHEIKDIRLGYDAGGVHIDEIDSGYRIYTSKESHVFSPDNKTVKKER